MDVKARAARRFVSLLRQLAEEREERHGWQSEASRLTGVSQGYISRIWRGKQDQVREEAIGKVIDNMGLHESFFYGPGPDDLPYQDFLPGGAQYDRRGEEPPGLAEWLASKEADSATMLEVRALRGMGFAAVKEGIPPSAAAYSAWLVTLRMLQDPATKKP